MVFHSANTKQRKSLICFFLSAVILTVYYQVGTHNFVYYDDAVYVLETPAVLEGLTPKSISWAFSTLTMANWHPLTWLSYMLDVQLFGPTPGAMLLENVAIHTFNTILLFILLTRTTVFVWRSAIVAALFALHPLHVESVAWIAERKDVLSTLFWLLSLYFYACYAENRNIRSYVLTLGAFTLGLMAKPMLVTVPMVMLLMDYWPLQRLKITIHKKADKHTAPLHIFLEKLPFLALAAVSCVLTVIAQQGAMAPLAVSSSADRISNSLNSYIIYLSKTFWPVDLCPFYPFPISIPAWQPICSAIIISAITILVFRANNRYPYLLFGWLWYLITLLPVIGIVRVGMQASADRYTYVPLIGIFIMLAWGVSDLWKLKFKSKAPLITIIFITIATLSYLAWQQVSYWKDATTLFTHTRNVTKNNYIAANILGLEQMKTRNFSEAFKLFDESFRQAPWYIEPYINQGLALYNLGLLNAAEFHFKQALLYTPLNPAIHNNLGITLADLGKLDEAIKHFMEALKLKPELLEVQRNLNKALELHAVANQINHSTRENIP